MVVKEQLEVHPGNSRRLAELEGLRAFAMTCVFFGHFEVLFTRFLVEHSLGAKVVEYLATWGHRGVSFFFVLTGFFVYRDFIERRQNYWSFIRSRLVRIYSVYWFALAIHIVLSVLFQQEFKLPSGTTAQIICILTNASLLHAIMNIQPIMVVSWTLTYLVLVYVVVPPLISALQMWGWRTVFRVCASIAGGLLWLMLGQFYPQYLSVRVSILAV